MTPPKLSISPLASALALALLCCGTDEGTTSASGDATEVSNSGGDLRRPDVLGGDLPITADTDNGDQARDSGDLAGDVIADSIADGEGDTSAEDDADGSGADLIDVVEDPGFEPVDYASLSLELLTDGGFTGMGGTDYQLAEGELSVYMPFASPFECSAMLTTAQMNRLLDAASTVNWDGLAETYRPVDNPDCCCDQIIHDLTVMATGQSGDVDASTDWCDESVLPEALTAFVLTLAVVGSEVFATCET